VTARPVALVLLAAALATYAGLALPTRRAAADLGDEYRRARERRRDASQRLSRMERRQATRANSTGVPGGSSGEPLVALRREILEAVKGSRVSNVRLSLNPGHAPVAASVHLSGEGRFEDVVRFTGTVAPPGGSIVLDRVRFAPGLDTISLELDAMSLEANP
jgi:hypothetical protein